MTILGIPGWAPTDNMQPQLGEVPPRLQPESSSVDCENFREGQYILVPEGFPPGSLRACAGGKDGLG